MKDNEHGRTGRKRTLLLILLCLLCAGAGYLIGATGLIGLPGFAVLHNSDTTFLSELIKMNELEKTIKSDYIEDTDSKLLGEEAIKAMFAALGDKYSVYYDADEYSAVEGTIKGTFNGIGVYLDMSDSQKALITRLVEDGPAQQAGLEAGDVITAVDDVNVVGLDYDTLLSKITGEKGSTVKITVDQDGETKDFTVTRSEINSQTVYSANYDGIGYIFLSEFGKGSADEVKEAAQKLIDDGATGLVLDLRFNGGGMLNTAADLADYLLGEATTGSIKDRNGTTETFTSDADKISIPYVILVNDNSASASEFLAGAVQQNGGTIIGKTTYGKGVAQILSGLSDGSGYKLTVEEYFVGDGVAVNGKGITPDIVVDSDTSIVDGTAQTPEEDAALQAAIAELKK